jgi:hypothetical protein
MTAKGHSNMGVKKFKWLTPQDERVRDFYEVLRNRIFSYSNTPAVGLLGNGLSLSLC